MYLPDTLIEKAVEDGEITISDFDKERIQPASYDILLGNKFIVTESHNTSAIDPHKNIFPETREIEIADDEPFTLHPNISILGISRDYFGSDKYPHSSFRQK